MKHACAAAAALFAIFCVRAAGASEVAVCTDQGRFVIELAEQEAPQQVANFLRYVDMAFYSGLVFHRVVPGFAVQGGGFDRDLKGRPVLAPVANESTNGLENLRGTVAAARSQGADSATSQFYVNLADNRQLDGHDGMPGYTVFGKVVEGFDVVERIGRLPTGAQGQFTGEVPRPLVAIESIARVDPGAADAAVDQAALRAAIESAASPADTLAAVTRYRAACGADSAEVTIAEAQAALAVGNTRRAVFVLEDFFRDADESAPTYEQALALYRQAVPENGRSPGQIAQPAEEVGACRSPPEPSPVDGNTASLDQMIAGQARIREFVAASEAYIACLDKIADDEQRTAEERNAAIAEHNRMVATMEQTANHFNDQIRTFKTRSR
jgi:cyclophilin family peptidyl-prolyl cis-trans isomerase